MQPRQEGEKFKGFLEFPGGHIEAGETPQIAAARECMEECEIVLKPEDLKLFKIYYAQGESAKVQIFTLIAPFDSSGSSEKWYKVDTKNPLMGIEDKIMPANDEIITEVVEYLAQASQL